MPEPVQSQIQLNMPKFAGRVRKALQTYAEFIDIKLARRRSAPRRCGRKRSTMPAAVQTGICYDYMNGLKLTAIAVKYRQPCASVWRFLVDSKLHVTRKRKSVVTPPEQVATTTGSVARVQEPAAAPISLPLLPYSASMVAEETEPLTYGEVFEKFSGGRRLASIVVALLFTCVVGIFMICGLLALMVWSIMRSV